jgi:hypothetical protein
MVGTYQRENNGAFALRVNRNCGAQKVVAIYEELSLSQDVRRQQPGS